MEKDPHLKDQVLFITNSAYEEVQSLNIAEEGSSHSVQNQKESETD
ncbi:hypothetical protein [Litchfieldia salsa]|uniref:Uncharacterized protein n=1 Tax=Litchfieldia salsa TaxID=930152 RepID=A0A1H0PDL9_9BACI|nr:hypothetical protein [Litchfieldia salsa]SDP03103.1 hypothetical protein SAMN05216565_101271 [Litchfieldia salsa]